MFVHRTVKTEDQLWRRFIEYANRLSNKLHQSGYQYCGPWTNLILGQVLNTRISLPTSSVGDLRMLRPGNLITVLKRYCNIRHVFENLIYRLNIYRIYIIIDLSKKY